METEQASLQLVSDNGDREAPSDAARKRAAVELIRSEERTLRRTARRFSSCEDDAEDAYQRALEILLTKAPTTDQRQLIKWMQTVTKHEALAVGRQRERVLTKLPPGADEDQDWLELLPSTNDGPADLAERHERVARAREALQTLKPHELKALTLLAHGYSYEEIGSRTGWSHTGGIQHRSPSVVQIKIDRTSPGIAFTNAQDPNDPELVRAVVSDGLSGAAGGQIELHRVGSSEPYAPLDTELVDGTLQARWQSDSFPAGEYEFRATAVDAAGNRTRSSNRSDGAQMVLPNPLKLPTAIRARFGGQKGNLRVPRSRTISYGGSAKVSGRLTAGLGSPLRGQTVTLLERYAAGASINRRSLTTRTNQKGLFSFKLRRGPSRSVSIAYTGSRTLTRASSRPLKLVTRSRVLLKASAPLAIVGGGPVVFSGRVQHRLADLPPYGKRLEMQYRTKAVNWRSFATVTADDRGRFRFEYSFSDDESRGVRFGFRALSTRETAWPYSPAASAPVSVTGR